MGGTQGGGTNQLKAKYHRNCGQVKCAWVGRLLLIHISNTGRQLENSISPLKAALIVVGMIRNTLFIVMLWNEKTAIILLNSRWLNYHSAFGNSKLNKSRFENWSKMSNDWKLKRHSTADNNNKVITTLKPWRCAFNIQVDNVIVVVFAVPKR